MAAASASTAAATASPVASVPSPHSALAFFDSHPASFKQLQGSADRSWFARGHAQLAATIGAAPGTFDELDPASFPTVADGAGWLPSADEEQAEVSAFVDWATASPHVRQVVEVLPAGVHARARNIVSAELHDFSPKGRIDDDVYAAHRDVWERITRGCAVIKIIGASSSTPVWRWAVRANRKFTGHEDDSAAADSKLYCVPGEAESVVVSHKSNGSVLHLASRDISVDGEVSRWVFLGSKKVHAACIWHDADDWSAQMSLFREARHEYVREMVEYVLPRLRAKGAHILATLSRFRLVINAEYVSSVGTGPTDNERIYGLAPDAREAYGFMLTCNTLKPAAGCELGVDMMSGLRLINAMGFQTVSAFKIPIADLPTTKAQVIPLPDIEGAVLYYSSSVGVVQLEKWKSAGYVVLRAVREKLKPFVFGSQKMPGLDALVERLDAESAQSSLRVEKKILSLAELSLEGQRKKKRNSRGRKKKAAAAAVAAADADQSEEEDAVVSSSSPDAAVASPLPDDSASFLDFHHPSLDLLGGSLIPLGCQRVSTGVWRAACPADASSESALRAAVESPHHAHVVLTPLENALERCRTRVRDRIIAIDHIPMTPLERDTWIDQTDRFIRWVYEQVVTHRRWKGKEAMDRYSALWAMFQQESRSQAIMS